MTTSELPPVITDALDRPFVGPVALILAALAFVLWVGHLLRRAGRVIDQAPVDSEYESAAPRWHGHLTWEDES